MKTAVVDSMGADQVYELRLLLFPGTEDDQHVGQRAARLFGVPWNVFELAELNGLGPFGGCSDQQDERLAQRLWGLDRLRGRLAVYFDFSSGALVDFLSTNSSLLGGNPADFLGEDRDDDIVVAAQTWVSTR